MWHKSVFSNGGPDFCFVLETQFFLPFSFLQKSVCVSTRSSLDCAVIRFVPRHRSWYTGVEKSLSTVCSRKMTARFTSSSVANILMGPNRWKSPAVVPYPVWWQYGAQRFPSLRTLTGKWLPTDADVKRSVTTWLHLTQWNVFCPYPANV